MRVPTGNSAASVRLDERGWANAIAFVDALFETLVEEQLAAKLRIAESGERPIRAMAAFAAFEPTKPLERSSDPREDPRASRRAATRTPQEARLLSPMQLAKVLADPLALQIVADAGRQTTSPSQFRREVKSRLGKAPDRHRDLLVISIRGTAAG